MRHTDPLRPRAALRCRATSPIHCTSAFLPAGMALFVTSCGEPEPASAPEKIRVLLDTDANNELDDQHAIAYMLMNGDVFDVEGITVNSTFGGGDANEQA